MRKKVLWSMQTIIMVVFMGLGIISCGNDDDLKGSTGTSGNVSGSTDNPTSGGIIGAWESSSSTKDYVILEFRNDNTGTEYYEINPSDNTAQSDNFTYSFNSSTMELRLVYYNDGEENDMTYKIKELTSRKFTYVDIEDDEEFTFSRYTGTLPQTHGDNGDNEDNGDNNNEDDQPDDTGTLSAPSNITSNVTGESIIISWGAVNGATKYHVYRSSSADGFYSLLTTVSNTYAIDDNPINGYNYYKVKSANSSTVSPFSSYTSVNLSTTPENLQQKPAAPTGVTVSNEGNNYIPDVRVRWNSVDNATTYYIYKSSWANGTYSKIGETSYASYGYTDSNAPTNGASAYYKVKAVNEAGESAFSDYAKYTSPHSDEAFSPAFTYRDCTVSGTTMTLRWTFSTGAQYGKATSVTLRVYNPYTEVWQDTSLSPTATSTSFSIKNKADDDGWVKAGIVISNAKGSYTAGAKVYNVKTKKWAN